MHFYLPNFEDLVDPDYDFITESNGPNRVQNGRYAHDAYAHEFFNRPIFDGMLVSKAVIRPVMEREIRRVGSIHEFCRLDPGIPVMGDCGAFTFVDADVPPLSTIDILSHYQELGFTYGVSIDHVVFASMSTGEKERRVEITLDNARQFLSQHSAQGHTFQPVGIIQGWDPFSRGAVLTQLVEMGYAHFALGGMVRSVDKQIRATLSVLHPILPTGAFFHLFGVARLSILPDLIRYGVTSADSASPIRRAFLGRGEDNYWLPDGRRYAAIRIPEVKSGTAKKRGISSPEEIFEKSGKSIEQLQAHEHKALAMLRSYSARRASFEDTLHTLLQYDALYGDTRDHVDAYSRTLRDRPWEECDCEICKTIGVEVIIFRGNNRNRRRGFHNARVFYSQFREEVMAESISASSRRNGVPIGQLSFDLTD